MIKPVLSLSFVLACTAALAARAGAPAAVAAIRGEVVDVQCALEKGDAGRGDAHAACAMSCARDGQPMAILTDDAIYLIAGDYTANKNAKLLDFAGRRVEAKGTIDEADGRKSINVAAMKVLK